MHCPGGNATDPIWRVLASSDGISSWTPLKPQHSNPNPNPLANQLWCINTSLLNTQQYKVRIKGKVEQSREGVAPSPTPRYSSYGKGSLLVALDYSWQHVYPCSFQIRHKVKQCTICQHTNYHDYTNHSEYHLWLELLWLCDIHTANLHMSKYCKNFWLTLVHVCKLMK